MQTLSLELEVFGRFVFVIYNEQWTAFFRLRQFNDGNLVMRKTLMVNVIYDHHMRIVLFRTDIDNNHDNIH